MRNFPTIAFSLILLCATSYNGAAQKKADKEVVERLTKDIWYLSSDFMQGRGTGTPGEKEAGDYIIRRYETIGMPAYKENYRLSFTFNKGKSVMGTRVWLGDGMIPIPTAAFPLPFSPVQTAISNVMPEVYEPGHIWMMPLYADKEEADDPHFEWEKSVHDRSREAAKQGATGILFYDSYNSKHPAEFNPKSELETLPIPAAVLTYMGYQNFAGRLLAGGNEMKVQLDLQAKAPELYAHNIAAYLDNKAKYTVVIGAHYDHLGYGEEGSSLSTKNKEVPEIHNGADDNASGTAGVLVLADWIKKNKLTNYNYLFVNFSGEELGLLGSKAFVKTYGLDSSKIAYMINMDMIGRLNDSTHALTVGGVGTSPVWGEVIKSSKDFKFNYDSSGVGPSDHSSFYYADIPVLFFFTGLHTDYHKPSDDANKINYEGQTKVLRYIYSVVKEMEKKPKPAFTKTKQTTVGKVKFKVTLGIMPDYSFQGDGVRVDGVSDDRPAIKAGIKAGDIITQLGEYKVNGMQSYMEALGRFVADDKTTVKVKRGDQEMTFPIQFK